MKRGLASLVQTDGFVEKVNVKVRQNQRFTISVPTMEFSNISQSAMYRIVTE